MRQKTELHRLAVFTLGLGLTMALPGSPPRRGGARTSTLRGRDGRRPRHADPGLPRVPPLSARNAISPAGHLLHGRPGALPFDGSAASAADGMPAGG
jgi:hypothetical protein